jgi:hypothetical protein
MNGINTYLGVRSFGAEQLVGTGRFKPNAAGAIDNTQNAGSLKGLFTATRTGVGAYRVAFALTGFKFPTQPTIVLGVSVDALANYTAVIQIGDWDNTNRRFDIQSHRGGVAQEIASNAANWVHFFVFGNGRSKIR